MTAREILIEMFNKIKIDYSSKEDRFTGVILLPDKPLDKALKELEELWRKERAKLHDLIIKGLGEEIKIPKRFGFPELGDDFKEGHNQMLAKAKRVVGDILTKEV